MILHRSDAVSPSELAFLVLAGKWALLARSVCLSCGCLSDHRSNVECFIFSHARCSGLQSHEANIGKVVELACRVLCGSAQ